MKKSIVIWIVALAASLPSMAQQERKLIRGGNDLFNTQKFEEAEVQYRKALEREDHSYAAAFNLADALYKQKKYDEALQQFSSLAKDQADKESLGELFHNIGNTLLAQNKLDESIEAYKQSLRNRPNSQETKYNLEYARKMKQEKENQDQNKEQDKDQNKEQEQNKEQNKDQDQNKDKEQDKDKDQQNKEQDQNKDQNKEQDQNKDKEQNKEQKDQPQPGEPKISPEDAKRLLNALEAEEQKTQDKVQKDKAEALKAKRMKIEKNW